MHCGLPTESDVAGYCGYLDGILNNVMLNKGSQVRIHKSTDISTCFL